MIGRRPLNGTRFNLFLQPPDGNSKPLLETVTVTSPVGSIGPGPQDDFMYTVVPVGNTEPYGIVRDDQGRYLSLPPWDGPVAPPAQPDANGHFDHLLPGDAGFRAAHLFGATRFTLDVWEKYLGKRINWHFSSQFDRLELATVEDWKNGQMGWGYLQVGRWKLPGGMSQDYALNFDIIAHEVGHAILMATTGYIKRREMTDEFLAFHEMSSDWVALISALHFETVAYEVLENTRGNLDTYNRLSRFAEFSQNKQVRLANNERTMSEYRDGWDSVHDLALPLIGAFFDIFVDLYHEILVDMGGVSPALEQLADRAEHDPSLRPALQRGFDAAYKRDPDAFKEALLSARDAAAHMVVESWNRVDPRSFRFSDIPGWIYELDERTHRGRFSRVLAHNFDYRQLESVRPGPPRYRRRRGNHADSARLVAPRA